MAQYGKSEYWEDRYQKDKEQFDWYQRYSGLKDIISQYVQPTYQILNVGAGNSRKYNASFSFPFLKAAANQKTWWKRLEPAFSNF